jgi:hypothetical protein
MQTETKSLNNRRSRSHCSWPAKNNPAGDVLLSFAVVRLRERPGNVLKRK